MSTKGVNCEQVDQGALDSRYLAGTLSEEEAEGFEAHFFGCERCWGLVQQGLEVQAAHESAAPEEIRPSSPLVGTTRIPGGGAFRARPWWGLAAAAALVLAVVGIRRLVPGSDTTGPGDVLRGGVERLVVTPGVTPTSATATWPRVPDADVYRVRLYATDGTLIAEREVADTVITLARDSLPLHPERSAFWEVQALDRLRNPIARSELTRTMLPLPAP
jgi:anti-sigma factor RsiW